MAAVAACAAIVLPCVLIGGSSPTVSTEYRYEYDVDYVSEYNMRSIKEYSENNGLNLLYYDWYDTAVMTEVKTHVLINSDEILGVEECVRLDDIDYNVVYAFTKSKVYLDIYNQYYNTSTNLYDVGGIKLNWNKFDDDNKISGSFNYKDYRYYITLNDSTDEKELFGLVTELLEQNGVNA